MGWTGERRCALRGRAATVTTVLAALAAGVVLLAQPAAGDPGDPQSDKARVQREMTQAAAALEFATGRAQQAGAAYNAARSQLPQAQTALAEARGRTAAAQAAATSAQRDADAAQADLQRSKQALDDAETHVTDAREEFDGFASAAYRGSDVLSIRMLLASRSPSQLADRVVFVKSIGEARQREVTRVTRARMAAAQTRNAHSVRKRGADAANAEAQNALDSAESEEATAQTAARRVTALVTSRQNALSVAAAERQSNQRRYADLQAESRRIAEEIRQLAAKEANAANPGSGPPASRPQRPGRPPQARPPSNNATGFLKPVDGYKSSDFGMRYDPYYNVWQLHAGTDFAAPGGAPIRASKAGRVIRAGWNGGYGNYTCVYHGNGVATCYAHQSRMLVSRGQYVERGEVIGRVGTTGASTGNHLHFEVRIGGEPVNPLRYL